MDIYCPKCGEPYDNDELHDNDEGMSYEAASKLFRTKGCSAVFGTRCVPVENNTTRIASALYDVLGDDMDGVASEMEDAEYLGYLNE